MELETVYYLRRTFGQTFNYPFLGKFCNSLHLINFIFILNIPTNIWQLSTSSQSTSQGRRVPGRTPAAQGPLTQGPRALGLLNTIHDPKLIQQPWNQGLCVRPWFQVSTPSPRFWFFSFENCTVIADSQGPLFWSFSYENKLFCCYCTQGPWFWSFPHANVLYIWWYKRPPILKDSLWQYMCIIFFTNSPF
jgi:hypothetical protein